MGLFELLTGTGPGSDSKGYYYKTDKEEDYCPKCGCKKYYITGKSKYPGYSDSEIYVICSKCNEKYTV